MLITGGKWIELITFFAILKSPPPPQKEERTKRQVHVAENRLEEEADASLKAVGCCRLHMSVHFLTPREAWTQQAQYAE